MRHQFLHRAARSTPRPNPVLYHTMLGPITADEWREAKLANVTLRQIEACALLVADKMDWLVKLDSRRSMAGLNELLESQLFWRLKLLFHHLMDVRYRPLKRFPEDELLFFCLKLDRCLSWRDPSSSVNLFIL